MNQKYSGQACDKVADKVIGEAVSERQSSADTCEAEVRFDLDEECVFNLSNGGILTALINTN